MGRRMKRATTLVVAVTGAASIGYLGTPCSAFLQPAGLGLGGAVELTTAGARFGGDKTSGKNSNSNRRGRRHGTFNKRRSSSSIMSTASKASSSSGGMSLSANPPLDVKPGYTIFETIPRETATVGKIEGVQVLDASSPLPFNVDPFELVKNDIIPFKETIKELVDTDHPVLNAAAKHFFEKRHGKRFRPTIVSLMSRAVSELPVEELRTTPGYKRQMQLGTITEMIHVASLIHDDVLDEAETRRGGMAVHKLYSNKVAVLAGDYLLARASVLLARLGNVEVVEIMATALDSLVQGEIMQLKSKTEELLDMDYYIRKSYYKTASLICNSCKSAALLAGHEFDSDVAKAAEEYGYHMGLAFQIVDDILDITGAASLLGKPAMADMSLGLATAPLLYAAEDQKDLRPLIKRRFSKDGDVQKAYSLVLKTDGVERSRELARWHAQAAVDAVSRLPESEARDALISVCHIVLTRNK